MIADGTTRRCGGCDNKVRFDAPQGWHHTDKTHWTDKPHKAFPRRYKRK